MNGAFKGLRQSDVYLTSYISKKQWQVASGSFENLGISKVEATPGSSTYGSLRVGYYEGSLPDSGSFSGSYDLNLQSTLTLQGGRRLPEKIIKYSIPRDCFGETIEEGSLVLSGSNCNLIDKEGLVLESSRSGYRVVGDIIYDQGLILLDKDKVNPSNESLRWISIKTINTWNVNCLVKDLEFNQSYNPSAENLEKYVPYITTVGLYNKAGELMATAKLSKPIKKCDNIDMTFKVNIDIS